MDAVTLLPGQNDETRVPDAPISTPHFWDATVVLVDPDCRGLLWGLWVAGIYIDERVLCGWLIAAMPGQSVIRCGGCAGGRRCSLLRRASACAGMRRLQFSLSLDMRPDPGSVEPSHAGIPGPRNSVCLPSRSPARWALPAFLPMVMRVHPPQVTGRSLPRYEKRRGDDPAKSIEDGRGR